MRERGGKAPLIEEAQQTAVRDQRKAFARRQWRRRWRTWRYVVVVLILAALAGGAVWALWFSSWLSVDGVDVVGTQELTEQQVRRAAGVPTGGPLIDVDLDRARARVAALAEVDEADVSRQWPDQVRIEVVERQPVAVVHIGQRTRALDDEGVLFLDYKRAPEGLPVVVTPPGTDSDALAEAAEVVSSLPETVAPMVQRIEVESVDQITLALDDDRSVVWGSATDSEQKGEVLAALLKQDAAVYDVSVPGQPTTSG